MRTQFIVGVILAVLLSSSSAIAQDLPAGSRILQIPGWLVLVSQDPFTDAWESVFAAQSGNSESQIMLSCDPERDGSPIQMFVTGLPALQIDSATVEYRIGSESATTGTWSISTGDGGSAMYVPDSLIASAMRAERLAVRVQDHTRLIEWRSGDAVYNVANECAEGRDR